MLSTAGARAAERFSPAPAAAMPALRSRSSVFVERFDAAAGPPTVEHVVADGEYDIEPGGGEAGTTRGLPWRMTVSTQGVGPPRSVSGDSSAATAMSAARTARRTPSNIAW